MTDKLDRHDYGESKSAKMGIAMSTSDIACRTSDPTPISLERIHTAAVPSRPCNPKNVILKQCARRLVECP
jgi:hypothetical protein